jgi:hypothetical protein
LEIGWFSMTVHLLTQACLLGGSWPKKKIAFPPPFFSSCQFLLLHEIEAQRKGLMEIYQNALYVYLVVL